MASYDILANNYDEDDDEFSSDDDGFCFFDNKKSSTITTAQHIPSTGIKPVNTINAQANISMTMTVTSQLALTSNNDIFKLSSTRHIEKTSIRDFLVELYDLVSNRAKTAPEPNASSKNGAASKQRSVAEIRLMKQKQAMAYKQIEKRLVDYFKKSDDGTEAVYWLNLLLIENSRDYKSNKYNSIASTIAKVFEAWAQKEVKNTTNLGDEIRMAAFVLATRHNIALIETISRVYELDKKTKNEFLLPLVNIIANKLDHKDKALLINSLMMHDHFDFKQILMPLLMQDKINVVEKYLSKRSDQQLLFVKYLDELCSQNRNIYLELAEFKVGKVSIDKYSRRYLSKLATRLMKTYQIDPYLCSNLNEEKFYKNLKYLLYRRYVEKSINYEPWRELVIECLENAGLLKETFIEMLISYDDSIEICKWIRLLEIDVERLPMHIQIIVNEYESKYGNEIQKQLMSSIDQLDLKMNEAYYELKLKDSQIELVDSKTALSRFLDDIASEQPSAMKNGIVYHSSELVFVGIDCEWKPTCSTGVETEYNQQVALLQIASRTRIYLLDMIQLRNHIDFELSKRFIDDFLINKRIIKVGYGLSQDIKLIANYFILDNQKLNVDAFKLTFLDLAYLNKQITNLNANIFDKREDTCKERGLSELVRICFGKPLNKSEQISNWEKRPLRRSQIMYAALDAYCLIEIFDYFINRLSELKISFDVGKCIGKKYKSTTCVSKAPVTKSSSNQSIQVNDKSPHEDIAKIVNEKPIRPYDLKVICDNMLGGLCKDLAHCGVNTILLENEKEHTEVARIARKENRYALTCGLPYESIRAQLPEGKCIKVITGTAKEQCSYILKLFNVDVRLDDLFSVCKSCGSNSFTQLKKSQIKFLRLLHKSSNENDEIRADTTKSSQDCRPDEDLLSKVNVNTLELINSRDASVKMQLDILFDTTIEAIDEYDVCNGCGHVYWKGPHWKNIAKKYYRILNQTNNKS